ncbi:STAS domain-containing protein [Thiomonas sp. FB-6]|uniref:STAS domain-containing protein n=1 Tax=Thiomonas sp. FB-6 TaxID=1158291 RepID=UPI00037270F1|nr:STAS domain-containing protein [Thiomonas sp. FB-6]
MADEASPKQRTFWGRVTEFVKNPTQDWALTRHENALREQQEQEHQRAREEQRKLDAFIRKRELAALRRLRKQQASGEAPDLVFSDLPDTGAGVGAPKAPQREATLRKINEIERAMAQDSTAESRPRPASLAPTAQMTRPPAPPPLSTQPLSFASTNTASRLPPRAGAEQATVPAPTRLAPTQMAAGHLEPTRLAADPLDAGLPAPGDATRIDPTQIDATQLAPTRLGAVATTEPPLSPLSGESAWLRSSQPSDPTRSMAVDVQEGVSSSPLFDQACMDFANGNDQGAERALLEAISGSPERKLENEFWLALFDLYRASGDMQRFEALVVDYLDRFQSSAPSWGSAAAAAPAAQTRSGAAGTAQASFAALGELDAAQARTLLQLARGGAASVSLDFNALTAAAPGAEQALAEAFKVLNAASGCEVEVAGLDHLLEACAAQSPAMQRDSDAAWWNARLEALRLAGAQEAYEATALDYCVTYEISPPSWEPSRARVRLTTGSEPAATGGSTRGGEASGRVATRFANSEMDGIALTRLDGEIRGGSEDFLQPLDEAAAGRSAVLIDLSALRRLDFASAGIVLNWVMAQSSAGRSVRFEGTHRLIAGLFAILGISSVAQVELRKT